eukprot:CAMPEP_0116854276 /NCGR_PEP_ID=MMETSP0418-20121206/18491_1 /TAXON_ID=1158023 /ORGANISM="Astrosyne radiata, Strain 13vi08-1A" /LENGTH=48 /DNA_ID= /DNA_START= /DNA_END= /DNA_ORIENTATION=
MKILRQGTNDSNKEWLKDIPQMAQRLELSLYRTAKSFEEYVDDISLRR